MLSIALSLILFNPLQSMVIIGLINTFERIKMGTRNMIINSYMLGLVHFTIMIIPTMFEGDNKFIIDILMLIVIGTTSYIYYKLKLNINVSIKSIVLMCVIFLISVIMGLSLFNLMFGNIYVGNKGLETFLNIWHELYANMLGRMAGVFLIILLRKGIVYEKK